MKKTIIAMCVVALSCWMGVAQAEDNLINISLGGGWHPIQYEAKVGSVSYGGGAMFQCQYQQFFKGHIGYGVGLEVDLHNASVEINETFESEINDPVVGSPYQLRVVFDDWKESQTLLLAELPVGIYGDIRVNKRTNLIMGAGVKVGLPLIKTYETKSGSIETKAYFGEKLDVEVVDLPHHGLYEDDEKRSGKIATNTLCTSLYADMMFCVKFNEVSQLHCGLYFSRGLTDLVESHESMEGGKYNGILNSDLVGECLPMSLGLKLGVTIVPSRGSERRGGEGW